MPAVRGVLEAEVVINLEECLVVAEAAGPRFGGGLRAEEADGAAADFFVGGGVAEFVVIAPGGGAFVEGERDEVIGNEFEGLGAAEDGDGAASGGGGESVA